MLIILTCINIEMLEKKEIILYDLICWLNLNQSRIEVGDES